MEAQQPTTNNEKKNMNYSLKTVNENTTNPIVKAYSQILLDNQGCRFTATFYKKDGNVRDITFVPRNEYNKVIGKETTEAGRQMVEHKAMNDMITITEFYYPEGSRDEAIRCRTLNLAKLITLKVAA